MKKEATNSSSKAVLLFVLACAVIIGFILLARSNDNDQSSDNDQSLQITESTNNAASTNGGSENQNGNEALVTEYQLLEENRSVQEAPFGPTEATSYMSERYDYRFTDFTLARIEYQNQDNGEDLLSVQMVPGGMLYTITPVAEFNSAEDAAAERRAAIEQLDDVMISRDEVVSRFSLDDVFQIDILDIESNDSRTVFYAQHNDTVFAISGYSSAIETGDTQQQLINDSIDSISFN